MPITQGQPSQHLVLVRGRGRGERAPERPAASARRVLRGRGGDLGVGLALHRLGVGRRCVGGEVRDGGHVGAAWPWRWPRPLRPGSLWPRSRSCAEAPGTAVSGPELTTWPPARVRRAAPTKARAPAVAEKRTSRSCTSVDAGGVLPAALVGLDGAAQTGERPGSGRPLRRAGRNLRGAERTLRGHGVADAESGQHDRLG